MRRLIVSAAVAALSLAAVPGSAQQPANALPPGDGRDIVATACTQCHALSVILAMRDGPIGVHMPTSAAGTLMTLLPPRCALFYSNASLLGKVT